MTLQVYDADAMTLVSVTVVRWCLVWHCSCDDG